MTITATFDPELARVRITGTDLGVLNANPYFEADLAGWTANGGTAERSTARAHQGAASALLTPTGSSGTPSLELTTSASVPVIPGVGYASTAWVYSTVGDTVTSGLVWIDAANNVSLVSGPDTTVPPNSWTSIGVSGVAPAGTVKGGPRIRMPNTPAATDLLWIDEAIIRPVGPTFAAVERSVDGVRWTTVRGGESVPVDNNLAAAIDDYEFVPDVANTYRFRILSPDGVQTQTQTTTITPMIGTVWLKSIARPFLNRPVTVVGYSEVTRPDRGGVFDVVGRSFPVAVTDVKGSRRYTLDVLTETLDQAAELDIILAAGDPMLIQAPAASAVPGMYAVIGDVTATRTGRASTRRVFSLPLTEVAAPGPGIVGATVTWQSVITAFDTWADVNTAEDTWQDLNDLIGDPTEVVAP